MKKYVLFLLSLFLFSLDSVSQTTSVMTQVFSVNGNVGTCKVDFIKKGSIYQIIARDSPFGDIAEFSKQNNGTVSTTRGGSEGAYRWWFCSPYYDANNNVHHYFIAIFDPTGNGVSLFFKEAKADKKTVSDSKYCYHISLSDWNNVMSNWIVPSTLDLQVVPQGDIFADGVNVNPFVK